MRFFPADAVPSLSVAPTEMPGAWVMPWYLPRKHKDRIWALLVAGLQRFDERLHFVELRWAERHYVEDGRIRLPRRVVVRLRGDAMSPAEPTAIVEFANKWTPGTPVFDFDSALSLQSFGWLGPFKVRVLYRITDVLLDRPPIADTQPIVDVLQEAARLLVTPIELLDFAEVMVERAAFGVSIESARAAAFGDALAARFESIFGSDAVAKVLVEAASNAPSGDVTRALARVGLVDGSTRMPLLDLVRDPEIRQRALEAFSRRIGEALWDEASLQAKHGEAAVAAEEPVKQTVEEIAKDVSVASPIVRDALARILDDRPDEGTKLLIDALRDGSAQGFSKEDALVAARALARIARRSDVSRLFSLAWRNVNSPILWEAAADYFTLVNEHPRAIEGLTNSANSRLRMREWATADRILKRATSMLQQNVAAHVRANLFRTIGELRERTNDPAAAMSYYRQTLHLYEEMGDDPKAGDVLLHMGRLHIDALELGDAETCLQQALQLSTDIYDEQEISREMGRLFFLRANFEQAAERFEHARELCESMEDYAAAAEIIVQIGDLSLRTGNLRDASEAYSNAHERLLGTNATVLKGLADFSLHEGDRATAAVNYRSSLELYRSVRDRLGESRALRAMAKLKYISDEPGLDELDASENIAVEFHDIHGIWLSKSLRAATLPPEEALPLLAECESFFEAKGLPWELCIVRGLIALFRGEPPERIQAILSPMIASRAEVVASLVKAGRNKDALFAVLMELPTS